MTRPRRLAGLLAFALLVVPAFAVAQSQATTGVIEGTVSDPSGAPIAGATVIVKNTATNLERTLATDADGRFRALLLPLGPYKVTVSLTGFARSERSSGSPGSIHQVGHSASGVSDCAGYRPSLSTGSHSSSSLKSRRCSSEACARAT